MPTFDASQALAVYEQPIANRLGDYGVAFPVGFVVYITTENNVLSTTTLTNEQTKATASDNNPASGSGDFGLAIFRRGKTYTITAGEQTLLDAAGYTTVG